MATERGFSARKLRAAIRALPEDSLFPLDQWDRTQRTHWLRWLGTFPAGYPAARIYGAIQCPHLLVYLAWALDLDRVRFGKALKLFPFDPKRLDSRCGAQCRRVRALFPWDEVEAKLRVVEPTRRAGRRKAAS